MLIDVNGIVNAEYKIYSNILYHIYYMYLYDYKTQVHSGHLKYNFTIYRFFTSERLSILEDLEKPISFIRKFGICKNLFFPMISKYKDKFFAGCEAVIKIPKIVKINSLKLLSAYIYENPVIIQYTSPKNNYSENIYKITDKKEFTGFEIGTIINVKFFVIFGYTNMFNYYEILLFKHGNFVGGGIVRSVDSCIMWVKHKVTGLDSIVGYCVIK